MLHQFANAISTIRGYGVPEKFIQCMSSLNGKAFEYYSCFISYSSKDQGFAERLYADLQNKDVRCWFAPEDMKIGDKIRDRSTTFLSVLSLSIWRNWMWRSLALKACSKTVAQ